MGPKYEAPPPDPGLAILQQQSQQQDLNAVQENVRQDTASLLARYGANLAFAGAVSGAGGPMTTGGFAATPMLGGKAA